MIGLESSKNAEILLGKFEGDIFEADAAWPRPKDEGQIDVKDRPVFSNHNVGVVSVLDIQQILNQAETRVGLHKATHHSFFCLLSA